jgi:hypothetical protein
MEIPTIRLDKSDIYEQSVLNEKFVREYQIAIEGMNVIKERLAHCARTEGVNQFENCKELREKYYALCSDRFHGMIFPPGLESLNRSLPGIKKKLN